MCSFILLELASSAEGILVDSENWGSRTDFVDTTKFGFECVEVENSKWMAAHFGDEYAVVDGIGDSLE